MLRTCGLCIFGLFKDSACIVSHAQVPAPFDIAMSESSRVGSGSVDSDAHQAWLRQTLAAARDERGAIKHQVWLE